MTVAPTRPVPGQVVRQTGAHLVVCFTPTPPHVTAGMYWEVMVR